MAEADLTLTQQVLRPAREGVGSPAGLEGEQPQGLPPAPGVCPSGVRDLSSAKGYLGVYDIT